MSKNWAIYIGINEYYNLQPLKYAVQDASSIRDFFLQEGRFEQVYYFAAGAPSIETPRGPMSGYGGHSEILPKAKGCMGNSLLLFWC